MRRAVVGVVTLVLAVGCTPGGTAATSGSSAAGTTSTRGASRTGAADPAGTLAGEVTVFAAASLEPVLDELADAFRARHPGVTFAPPTLDGSATLATQVVEGARADVLVTADEATMRLVVDAGMVVGAPVVVATNTPQVVVPAGNPRGVADLADLGDLARDGGAVVLCAPEVPCGRAARAVLDAAGVTLTPASLEQNVTAVLTKVALGEADAGVVYRTDVQRAGDDVEGVDVAQAAQAVTRYPAATLAEEPAAAAFVAFLASDEAQGLLAAHGFGPGAP